MPEPVIVATGRTPVGRAVKGSLAEIRPADLLAGVARAVVDDLELDPASIDDFVIGHTMSYGEGDPINITRGTTFLAGFPETLPSTTVNRFCGSSLQAIRVAAHAIAAGEADTYLVGGVESVSQGAKALVAWEPHPAFAEGAGMPNIYISMGDTAENVADQFAITREEMDRFAQQSQERAVEAQKSGFFSREIVPVTLPNGNIVDADDGPRPQSTLEALSALPPVFREDGRVTAGNACPLNDGAAVVVVMDADKARAEGYTPLARIVSTGVSGLAPEIMGVGPIEAVRQAVARAGMSVDDVEVVELNEAFAAQVLAVAHELGIDPFSSVLNPHGGAIALGHPFGMTGTRIMTTLINDLQTLDRTIGVETMCVGGGQGIAMVIERLA